jgi:hypothetical protein
VWITRDARDKLTRDNTRLAEQIAVEQAGNPVLMNLARARRRSHPAESGYSVAGCRLRRSQGRGTFRRRTDPG